MDPFTRTSLEKLLVLTYNHFEFLIKPSLCLGAHCYSIGKKLCLWCVCVQVCIHVHTYTHFHLINKNLVLFLRRFFPALTLPACFLYNSVLEEEFFESLFPEPKTEIKWW